MDEYKVRVEYKLDIETSLWHYRILDDEDNPTTTDSLGHVSLLDAKAEVLRALRELGYLSYDGESEREN